MPILKRLILHCELERIETSERGGSKPRERHEDICESMELFAREVMSEFAERAPQREAAKRERYAETIERLQNFHSIDIEPRLELAVPANPSI